MEIGKRMCIVVSTIILACGISACHESGTVVYQGHEITMEFSDVTHNEISESKSDDSSDSGYHYNEEIPLEPYLQENLYYLCSEYGVPESIALGVINTESCFDETASCGICYGYMQVSAINADFLYERIGVTNIYDSYQNIKSGVYMISDLYQKYGNWHMALIAYNCGSTGAERDYFSKGLYESNYSNKVMNQVDYWEGVLNNG